MQIAVSHFFSSIAIVASMVSADYFTICLAEPAKPEFYKLTRLFPADVNMSVNFDESIIATSVLDLSQGRLLVIVPVSNGVIVALNGETGGLEWKINAPTPDDQDEEPIVVIPTFIPDKTHPAGLVALKIVLEEGIPKLKRFWQFPDPSNIKAVQAFRSHPSLPVISTLGKNGDSIVWIVDIGDTGTMYGIRIKDGSLMAEQSLLGAGRQLSAPLIYGNTLYFASIMPGTNKAMIEAYRIESQE